MPRKIILAIATVISLSSVWLPRAVAQDPSAQAISKARQLIEVTGAIKLAKQVMTRTLSMQIAAQRKTNPKIPIEFWGEFEREFKAETESRMSELATKFATLYAANFTVQEMNEMLAFYRTDTGKKAIHEMPRLSQEGMKIGAEWGREIGEAAAKRAVSNLKKKRQ